MTKTHDGNTTRRMARLATVLVCALAMSGCQPTLEVRFHNHVRYLAADQREGRGVGSKGLKASAEYIAVRFKQMGLEPAGDCASYYQTFSMTLDRELTSDGRLAFGGDSALAQGRDFIPMAFSSNDAFTGDVVFCGYGIMAEDKKWDDFAHVDLSKKVALMLMAEPPTWADADGFPTRHSMLRSKVYNAKDRGAVAVIFVNPAPAGGQSDRLTDFDGHTPDDYGIPAFHVKREVIDHALASAGVESLASLEGRLNAGEMASKALSGLAAAGAAGFRREESPTSNVVARLPGTGTLADEWIVVGAHYDHLGIRKPMGRKFKAGKPVDEDPTPQIHNGADDNASGTSGLIEIARMMKSCANRNRAAGPRRGILFVAFSAEETGLHGSKHFVEHCRVPIENIVAMLNMDMIGRLDPATKELTVFGTGTCDVFPKSLAERATTRDLKIASTDDPGGRSDHAAFIAKNIPALHFYTGSHRDYHQPGDDTDKINAGGGAEVTRLVADLAWELATSAERPAYKQVKSAEQQRGVTGFRVVMGLTPNYTDTSRPGMGVDAVSSEGPAEIAGIRAGDRIIRINGKTIANVYDYMAATRGNSAGDKVEVVVLRGEEEMTLKVTLAGAR